MKGYIIFYIFLVTVTFKVLLWGCQKQTYTGYYAITGFILHIDQLIPTRSVSGCSFRQDNLSCFVDWRWGEGECGGVFSSMVSVGFLGV